MIWLPVGILCLALFLLAVRPLLQGNPATLARLARWGMGIAAAIIAAALMARRLFGPAMLVLTLGLIAGLLVAGGRSRAGGAPRSGATSRVDTPHLRMTLDQTSGDVDGTVLTGRYAGTNLRDLGRAELLELFGEFRSLDDESAQLLKAYINRVFPDFDLEAGRKPGAAAAEMSREQALAILGLEEEATPDEIASAHRRLIRAMHPDQGGSDYLAAQINRARDVLLGAA